MSTQRRCRNIDDVISALGGPVKLGQLINRHPQNVFSWRARGIIPSHYYFLLLNALEECGYTVPRSLFNFEEVRRGHAA